MKKLFRMFKKSAVSNGQLIPASESNYQRDGSCQLCKNNVEHLLFNIELLNSCRVKFCKGRYEQGWTPVDNDSRAYLLKSPEDRAAIFMKQNSGKMV